jgi:NADH-quinone oxidoreductase subunit E
MSSPDHKPRLATLDATAAAIIAKYPQPRSACLPLLHLAQEHLGWISQDTMEWVAAKIGVTPMQVYEVVTFYPMFQLKPIGKQHVRVCRTLSCALRGAYHTMESLEQEFGCKRGETSADGAVTLEFVECIAQCGPGPVVQTSDALFENVAGPAKVAELVSHLRTTVAADSVGKRPQTLGSPEWNF